MKAFTYSDYIKCIHTLRLNAVFKLAEEDIKYNLGNEESKDEQTIKQILKSKKEMSVFINNFLKPKEKIKYTDLIEFDNTYILRRYKVKKEKLMYRLKYEETFFLVEEVSKLDNIILYDILNYCISIMQEWNLKSKIKKENYYPIIVPVIIYTGSEKINIGNIKKDNKIGDYIFKNYKVNLNYNLININKIPIATLMKINTKFSNIMLKQKFKNKKGRIN